MGRQHSPLVAGTLLVGPGNDPLFCHSMQHSSRYTEAVLHTTKGVSYDFNPWERYKIDGGYCLDAPEKIPAGSHTGHSDRHAFSSEVFRG